MGFQVSLDPLFHYTFSFVYHHLKIQKKRQTVKLNFIRVILFMCMYLFRLRMRLCTYVKPFFQIMKDLTYDLENYSLVKKHI